VKAAALLAFAVALGAMGCGARTDLGIPDAIEPQDSGFEAAPQPALQSACVLYGGFSSAFGTDTDKGWKLVDNAWIPLMASLSPPECAGQCGYDGTAVNAAGRLLFLVAPSTSGGERHADLRVERVVAGRGDHKQPAARPLPGRSGGNRR
jgi:hypothetical protein